jgi:hypothetical protein
MGSRCPFFQMFNPDRKKRTSTIEEMHRSQVRSFIAGALMILSPLFNVALSQQQQPTGSGTKPVEVTSPEEDLLVGEDYIPIVFELRRGGRTDVVSYQKGSRVYLPVLRVFDFLRIKSTYSPGEGLVTGFFVSPDTPYTIDAHNLRARVGKRQTTLLPDDVALRGDSLFLRVDMFDKLFGLPVVYRPRQLMASLVTQVDLPAFRDIQTARMEKQFNSRPQPLKPEVVLDRQFYWINGGQLDYTLRQSVSSSLLPSRTFSTRATGILLGGDAELRLLGTLSSGFSLEQTRARWRYVPNASSVVKQFVLGDYVSSGLIAREMYGFEMTNHPANPRIVFAEQLFTGRPTTGRGVYMFEGTTLRGIDKNTSGVYGLSSNLRYGVNYIDLKEYGEWGETFTSSYRVVVPSTLVPPGELDYDVQIGRLRDVGDPWHGSATYNWGVTSRITAGAGTEFYGVEALPTKIYPNLTATARINDHVIASTLLSPSALLRGTVEYTHPSLIGGSFTFTQYRNVRMFNPRGAINEMSATGIAPFSLNGYRFSLEAGAQQTILDLSRERRLDARVSAFLGQLSPSLSTSLRWNHSYNAGASELVYHESEPALRARLPANLFVSIATPYDHIAGKFRALRLGVFIEPIPRLSLEFQYDRNLQVSNTVVRMRLLYTFPQARVLLGTTSSSEIVSYDQSVSGSIGVVPELGEFFFDYNTSRAAFGSMLVAPYLDANMNNRRDPGEQLVSSAKLLASTQGEGGFRLTPVEGAGWLLQRAIPYQEYTVAMQQGGLENPLWIPRYRVLETNTAPGVYTYVPIPVITGGSLRGTALVLKGPNLQEGVEYLKVTVREDVSDEELARLGRPRYMKTVETFSTGDFELIGVPPGKFTVSVDPVQLASMGLQCRQCARPATVEARPEGDVVEGLNFVLIERK